MGNAASNSLDGKPPCRRCGKREHGGASRACRLCGTVHCGSCKKLHMIKALGEEAEGLSREERWRCAHNPLCRYRAKAHATGHEEELLADQEVSSEGSGSDSEFVFADSESDTEQPTADGTQPTSTSQTPPHHHHHHHHHHHMQRVQWQRRMQRLGCGTVPVASIRKPSMPNICPKTRRQVQVGRSNACAFRHNGGV